MSDLHYTRQGAGEPVVLVHGIGHQGRAWDPVVGLLAEHHDVVVVDLPGHGRSPVPDSYEITRHADTLEALFAELGLDRPHVVGNSLGGHIAFELGHRGSVRSVTALSPGGFYTPLGWLWAALMLLVLFLGSLTPTPLLRRASRSPRMRRIAMGLLYVHGDRLTPEAMVSDTLNLRRSPGLWGQALHDGRFVHRRTAPEVPATIAWGDRDLLLLPTQARRARRRLPEVRHVTLKGCGHCPMLDDPQGVVAVSRETFARATQAASPAA